MFKKEFKSNLKGLLIWSIIMTLLFAIVYLVYPSLIEDAQMMNEFLKAMDEKMLALFNMDVIGLDSVFGWVATEGYLMILLVGGCYFGILGSNIVLKEENDKTIEFLYAKPISRSKIITSKLLCGLSYAIIFNTLIGLTNLIGLYLSNDLDLNKLFLITLLPIFSHSFIFVLSVLISTFLRKTSQSIGICLGSLFGLYFISIISSLADIVEFLKYLTPFYYVEARSIILNSNINLINIIVLLGATILLTIMIYRKYSKKELI